MGEVGCEDAAGSRRSGTAFRWAWRGGRGADPGVVHDLPHRRRRDKVAEPDKLVLHPSVHHAGLSVAMRITSWRIAAAVDGRPDVGGSSNSHLRVTGRRRQPSSVAGVTANTSPHQRRGTNRDIAAAAGRQARSGSVRHGGARRVSCRSTNGSGVYGYLVPGQHRQATYEQLDDRNDHSAMILVGKSVQARASNEPLAELNGLRGGPWLRVSTAGFRPPARSPNHSPRPKPPSH